MAAEAPVPYLVTFFTHDMAAQRRFYGELVGLELHSEAPDVYFLCGTPAMSVQILAAGPQHGFGPGDPPSAGNLSVGFGTQEHLDAALRRLAAAGFAEVTRHGPDGNTFTSHLDPDGRAVALRLRSRARPAVS